MWRARCYILGFPHLFLCVKGNNHMPAEDTSIFYNSDYIVIEYMDFIKNPYFILLKNFKDTIVRPDAKDIFPLYHYIKRYEIESLDNTGLAEWYVGRKHQNIIEELANEKFQLKEEEYDMIAKSMIDLSHHFITDAAHLPLLERLSSMKKLRMVTDIIIYYPFDPKFVKEDLKALTGYDFTIMSDFKEIIELTKENSTYFLSDIRKMKVLQDAGYLKYASIILPIEYRYNKRNQTDYLYDFAQMFDESPFKISFMFGCSKILEEDIDPLGFLGTMKFMEIEKGDS